MGTCVPSARGSPDIDRRRASICEQTHDCPWVISPLGHASLGHVKNSACPICRQRTLHLVIPSPSLSGSDVVVHRPRLAALILLPDGADSAPTCPEATPTSWENRSPLKDSQQ